MGIVSKESRVLAFIGPSGSGKSSVLKVLFDRGLISVTPTWTDRPPRKGEDELEHRFVSEAEFSAREARQEFAKVVQPFALPYRYGLPFLESYEGRLGVVMIRAPFVGLFRRYYPRAVVYQLEADFDFARDAVLARSEDEPGTRLSNFEAEVTAGRQEADRVFRNDGKSLDRLADAVERALREDGLISRS